MSNQVPPFIEKTSAASGQGRGFVGFFEVLFDRSPVAMCAVSADGKTVVAVNEAWVVATGVSTDAALGKGLECFGRSFAAAFEACEDPAGGVGGRSFACALPPAPGGGRRIEVGVSGFCAGSESFQLLTAAPLAAGSFAALSGGGDALEANRLLQQQMRLHPDIEKLARVGHWTNAEGSENLVWSPGLYEIAGLPVGDTLHRNVGRAGIHPEDLPNWLDARAALDGRDVTYRWARPDGELRWLRTRMGRTAIDSQKTVAFGVVQDITEELEAKRALAQELGFVSNIAAQVPGVIYRARRAADGASSMSFVSPSVREVLGVDPDAVLRDQRLMFSHISREDLPMLLAAMDQTCVDLSPLKVTFRVKLRNRGVRWVQADAATQREPDGATVWHGFLTDVTDQLLDAQAMERQHRLLVAVQKAQAAFIELDDKRQAFDGLLASFLSVTDSAFGFVGEVLYDANEQPFLRTQAITNIAWDDSTREKFEELGDRGMEFRNLSTLFGHALKTGETVISNNPASDPLSGGLPPGHPPLNSFLGVPLALSGKLVAMVGLANKEGGYSKDDVAFLQPLLGTVLELVVASRAGAERRRSRLKLHATSALLAEKSDALQATFDSMDQGLIKVDANGRVRFYNQRLLELVNLPEHVVAGQPLVEDVIQFQMNRGDFRDDLDLVDQFVRVPLERPSTLVPGKYVRRSTDGKVLELVTRCLPLGGYVRTVTDVTSYVDAQEALKEERQRLQWVLEATRPGIWEVNVETKETNCSERWADMLGYTVAELAPTTTATWARLVHPDDLPRAKRQIELHLKGDAPFYECDVRMHHKSGHWMWVNDRGRVHRRDALGKALYMSGTLLDINDRVAAQEQVRLLNANLERRVVERTAELERSMKDMETISYSIAHDLRAPLRSVNGFASLIADDGVEQLSPEARRMFERIANSSRDMGQMITDMLELLRVVRVDLNAVPVDMSALAQSVSEALAPSMSHALIGIKPLPRVMGDATLLRQVLVNLMDNALKYSKHLAQPELVLGFDERQRAFYLRDNGMGFDMARADKLFGLFQRMHANIDVPGTGVGLAIVARIVERHGGRIWAEAESGKGATFWWTLPRG